MINYRELLGEDRASVAPYQPGKPIKEVQRELGIENVIKLASNENPLGCSDKAIEALKDFLPDISRYPIGDSYYLRKKIAEFHNVSMDNILIGAGSDEIIQILYIAFLKECDEVLSPAPSFGEYYLIAKAMKSDCRWVECNDDLSFNFDNILSSITDKSRFIFLANPNNPTGLDFGEKEFIDFMDKVPSTVIVALDEAYKEYQEESRQIDTIGLMKKYKNLISLKTFSKAYGLASIRCGYIIAHVECIAMLNQVRQPFNVNMASQVMAEAALSDEGFLNKVIKSNLVGKEFIYKSCENLGLKYIDTEANFLLIDVGDGKKVFEDLLKLGVIVRFLGHPKLNKYIRVSIGTDDENKIFIDKLKTVLGL